MIMNMSWYAFAGQGDIQAHQVIQVTEAATVHDAQEKDRHHSSFAVTNFGTGVPAGSGLRRPQS